MHFLTKEDTILPTAAGIIFLFIVGIFVNTTGAPALLITDSLCTCTSDNQSVFNCRRYSAFINKSRRLISSADFSFLKQETVRYLDSTGYHRALWDSIAPDSTIVHPGTRISIRTERIHYHSTPSDSVFSPPPLSYALPIPFDASLIKNRANELTGYFTEQGYPFAAISTGFQQNDTGDSVTVTFTVTLDKYYQYEAPTLRGSFTTAEKILLRDIDIQPDALFNSRALSLSIERLQSRSYISEAYLLPPEIISSSDTSDTGRVIVPFLINDHSGMGLDGAAGLEIGDNDDPQLHGTIQFYFNNIFHHGEEARLSYLGDRERQRLDMGFLHPWPFSLPFIFKGEGGIEVQNELYGYMYGKIGVYAEPGPRWRAGISATTTSATSSDAEHDARYTGMDLILQRQPRPYRDGTFTRELTISTGSGFSRKERVYNRSHIDFTLGGHLPTFAHQAVVLRAITGHLISREESFVPAELYRVGGNSTLRGYAEDQFAFRSVFYGQLEYLYYFRPRASVYIFSDCGAGFEHELRFDNRYRRMLGYGLGVRLPARNGTLSVAWARSIDDYRNFGRVHVRYQSNLAALSGATFSFTRN